MSDLNIFITGATGYLGGTVLSRLLSHPNASKFSITTLVRSEEKASKLRLLGVNTILGSYTDSDLSFLTDAAAAADVNITIAHSDILPAARAILDGVKHRFEKTGKRPVLIHTSGVAFLADDSKGLHGDQVPTSDLNVDALEAIPASMLHRNVDTALIDADKEGYVSTYIITPGTIYGVPSGIVSDKGAQNMRTVQIPVAVNTALVEKQAGYSGDGLNKWSAVDINDAANFYTALLDSILTSPGQAGHGREGYYFLETFAYRYIDLISAVAETLFDLGVSTTREPKRYTKKEQERLFGIYWHLFAANCLATADRARALGWKHRSAEESRVQFLENVKAETVRIVQAKA